MELFWREGYDGTGVDALERATGVDRKGLYNAFGSKHELFLEVMGLYLDQAETLVLAPLETQSAGRREIEHLFGMLSSPMGHLKDDRGCLVCLTAAGDGPPPEPVRVLVDRYFRRLREAFVHALRGAQARGDLAPGRDPEALGDFLVGTVLGLSSMARAGRPRRQIQRFVETALSTLD